MSSINPLKESWAKRRTTFGVWSGIPSSFSAELIAGSDLDYVCVDQQHGVIDYTSMVPMLQAIGLAGPTPITRVLHNDPWLIMKALDAGALGVIVPLVNNADEAARAVAACRYPPQGIRSYGPIRAANVIGSNDPKLLVDETLCIVMVETTEGFEQVDEIASTPGVDGIYIGPADLALALGLPPTLDIREAKHLEAVERIREACQQNNIAAGIQCASGESAKKRADQGFTMITIGADADLLSDAVRRELTMANGDDVEVEHSQRHS
jgi:4-hydroxy-2-oxoheptanedioate aldolase